MQSLFKDSNGFRNDLRVSRTPIIEKRKEFKESLELKKDKEKILKEIILSNYTDFNLAVQQYRDVINSGVDVPKDLIEKTHFALSKRKNEQLKLDTKKYTNKNKNNIIKILEEIKLNNWKIDVEITEKLINLSK